MPIRTLIDGRKVNLPDNLSEAEQTNLVLKMFPGAAALAGMSPDIEREYDIESGVPDIAAQWGAALADGNPEEIKAEFDSRFGKGNWGLTPFSNEPYVTPEGLRNIGITPKDERKVVLNGMGTQLYDLVAYAPEIVTGAASVAAELAVPVVPGTGAAGATFARGILSALTGRGLLARSARAGIGDAAANVGLEGVQTLRGTQKESLGDILQDAGTEGLVVGLGSIVLGAPFAAAGSVGNRVKAAAKDMAPETQGTGALDVTDMLGAQNRNIEKFKQNYMSKGLPEAEALTKAQDDVMLLSLRTLIGDTGTVAGNIMTKIEGVGTKYIGDAYAKRVVDFMNKYRSIVIESKRLGDDEFTTVAKLKNILSESEQSFGNKIMDQLVNFRASELGQIDKAASTLRGFKDLAEQKLSLQYKQGMRAFDGPDLYGQFKNIGDNPLSSQRLANFITRVSEESGIGVDDVLNSFGPGSPLHNRIVSRIRVDKEGRVIPVKNAKAHQGSDITPNDLFLADKATRSKTYAQRANLAVVRRNLEISSAAQNQISRLPEVSSAFKSRLQAVNKKYAEFANLYRGKNGLFEQIARKTTDDAQVYLNRFINGAEGSEFTTMLDKLEKAFGPKAVGGSIGLQTKEQILGTLGINFVRENKADILSRLAVSPEEGAKAAKAALNKILSLENTIGKKMGGGQKAKKALNQLFKLDSLEEYKSILRQIASGRPEQSAKGAAKLSMALNFREASKFVEGAAQVGSNLSKSNLDDVVSQLRSFEAMDKRAADYYRDLLYSENWGTIVSAYQRETASQKNLGIKAWADDWIDARSKPNGVSNMQYIFGKDVYNAMDDLALNVRGAMNIDPNAGALSVAEQHINVFRRLMHLDFTGSLKPLGFIFGAKQFAPGGTAWNKVNAGIRAGKTPEEIVKSGNFAGFANSVRKASDAALTGRNGLFAASVSAFMEDADQIYPLESEVPAIAPRPRETVQEAQPAQPTQQQQYEQLGASIMQMMKAAQSIPGTGTSGLAQGAKIAAGAR